MKTAWAFVLIAVLTLGGATLMLAGISGSADAMQKSKDPNTMAAYRDGLYHARLQAQNGQEPHMAVGRWQTVADRQLFAAGFRHGYADFYAAHPDLKQRLERLQIEGANFAEQPATAEPGTSPKI